MKKILTLFAVTLVLACLVSCGENDSARRLGRNQTVKIPSGHKLVTASWTGSQLWYLVRPMRANEQPDVSFLLEKSNYGWWQGSVTFVESKN